MLTALEGPATPLLEKEDILPLAYNMALLNTDTGQKHTVALSSTFKTILLYEKLVERVSVSIHLKMNYFDTILSFRLDVFRRDSVSLYGQQRKLF